MEEQLPGPDVFSVRIVSIDHYMAPPVPDIDICYSSFQGGKVNEVPVIRIYGSTPAGQKTCLHVHRALPYLYVPCADLLLQLNQAGEKCTQLISFSLEKALKLKGNAGSKRQHVHSCTLVRAKRLYGYYSAEELFAKIYLYHPQDVARAANFLLGGAVLDQSLQPHESHIPFLLQFLVDYNLYGMGHLHVSRMKFRHPVPDRPSRMSKGLQADSSCNSPGISPIWISSTIPTGWVWDSSSQLDSSSCQDSFHVKRQSTCELEGDATVDDILNQQLKMYSSLSQTSIDVKMVQSLIPIWEEEFARTGVHEHALLSVPGKPLPIDVLRILSFGLELENNLMELFNVVGNDSSWTPLGKDVRHLEQLIYSSNENSMFEDLKVDKDVGEALTCPDDGDAKAILLLQGRARGSNNVEGPIGGAIHPEELIGNDRLTYETTGSTDIKVVDNEALGLLSWLASSQAAEDMNSDDELARETILTPLLPSPSIDKVLAKASLDFENESQQECQDILDSVENYDNLKEEPSSSDRYSNKSSSIIPQLDGSADDQDSNPDDPSNTVNHNETQWFPRDELQQDTRASFISKSKRNQPQWGSLPFSSSKTVECDLDLHGGYSSKVRDSKVTCVEVKNQDHRDGLVSKEESTIVRCSVRDLMRRKRCHQIDPSDPKSPSIKKVAVAQEQHYPKQIDSHAIQIDGQNMRTKVLVNSTNSSSGVKTGGHDVRMPTEALTWHGETCHSHGELSPSSSSIGQESASLCFSDPVGDRPSKSTHNSSTLAKLSEGDGGRVSGDSQSMRPIIPELSTGDPRICVQMKKSDPDKEPLLKENLQYTSCLSACVDGCVCPKDHEADICRQQVPHISPESVPLVDTLPSSPMLQFQAFGTMQQRKSMDSGPFSLIPTIDSGSPSLGLIGMTLNMKPPQADVIVGTEFTSSSTHTSLDIPLRGGESHEGISVNRRLDDEALPFFAGGDEESPKTSRDSESDCGPTIMGVPTHYQNDGSYLYMLTHLFSPPSADAVSRWLFLEDLGKDSKESIGGPSSPEGICGSQMDSQDPENDDCRNHSPEFGPVNGEENILDQLKQQSLRDLNDETNISDERIKRYQGECSITKEEDFNSSSNDISQISGPDGKTKPTPLSQIGFRDPASLGAGQQLTLLSIEIQAASRGDLRPDPRFDAVNLVVLAFQEDSNSESDICVLLRTDAACDKRYLDGISCLKVMCFSEEKKLIRHIINLIGSTDPDVLMGWDIQGGSLGFLAERAIFLGIGLLNSISRTPTETKVNTCESGVSDREALDNVVSGPLDPESGHVEDAIIDDEWGRTHASGVHVGGRIVLNIWRLMRGEVKLNMYTIEAVAEAVLRRKVPHLESKILNRWFTSGPARARFRCIKYVVERAKMNFEIMNQLDMINRTSELARVFGIEFFSVLSRGSQYRVESMLLRLAHSQNYVAISPASQQVASQPAMECLPLVMEPESGFYADPVVVLDFQSLYPSMIIAYNLCFCTCLGNAVPSKANTLGVSSFSQDLHQLHKLKDDILLTPNGIMYVPSKVRQGILPRLLEEILSTRIMVKQAMKKLSPSEQVLHRIFNARQLALKLIANVTYGYTAAGFSGRMPCAELADSIVQCGRRTLEHAISLVNAHNKWNARVIYGDTDSLFVLLKGRSREEAFEIGREIASEVTAANPNPVTLKMEKVYHPCFLLTKKRYVGYSYENPDQQKPVFDAKGIETVRRDTCGAVSKTLEQSLRLFFACKDIEKVKDYLLRQWTRILSDRVSLQDFIFAKEVRLGTYRTSSSLPPAAIVATKAMRSDPRAEPRYGERVPYVVVHGEPGSLLVDMVVEPLDLLALGSPFRLNDVYYIGKQIIPALQRVFGLVGADLNRWFSDMPRPARELVAKRQSFGPNSHRTRIDFYYLSKHCSLCGELVQGSAHFCDTCSKNEAARTTAVVGRTSKLEKEMHHLASICRHCGGGDWIVESGVKCNSLACSVFFERRKVQKELQAVSTVATEAGLHPRCMVEWF